MQEEYQSLGTSVTSGGRNQQRSSYSFIKEYKTQEGRKEMRLTLQGKYCAFLIVFFSCCIAMAIVAFVALTVIVILVATGNGFHNYCNMQWTILYSDINPLPIDFIFHQPQIQIQKNSLRAIVDLHARRSALIGSGADQGGRWFDHPRIRSLLRGEERAVAGLDSRGGDDFVYVDSVDDVADLFILAINSSDDGYALLAVQNATYPLPGGNSSLSWTINGTHTTSFFRFVDALSLYITPIVPPPDTSPEDLSLYEGVIVYVSPRI